MTQQIKEVTVGEVCLAGGDALPSGWHYCGHHLLSLVMLLEMHQCGVKKRCVRIFLFFNVK